LKHRASDQITQDQQTSKHKESAPSEVKIVDKEYMTSSYKNKKWEVIIDQVAAKFELNEEQARAYHIIANH
jgi:hypothetical protein